MQNWGLACVVCEFYQQPASGEDAMTTLNGSHNRVRAGKWGQG